MISFFYEILTSVSVNIETLFEVELDMNKNTMFENSNYEKEISYKLLSRCYHLTHGRNQIGEMRVESKPNQNTKGQKKI